MRCGGGPGNGSGAAQAMAVSPNGAKLFVTGESPGRTSQTGYATVAYRAATGKLLWAKRYNGPGNRDDSAHAIAVAPTGAAVFVTGSSWGAHRTGYVYATLAYRG